MSDGEGAIYSPPKEGLPYLVVTFTDGDWKAHATSTRSEARVLLARRTRRAKAQAEEVVVRLAQQ